MSEFRGIDIVWGNNHADEERRIDHVWERHLLSPDDVEAVLLNDDARDWPNHGNHPAGRRLVVGRTPSGQYLQIIVERAGPGQWMVITAFPAGQQWIDHHTRATGRRTR